VGNAASLQTHLAKLQAQTNEAEVQATTEIAENCLRSELCEEHNGRSCLNIAVYYGHPECLRILLEYATKAGPETFKKLIKAKDDNGGNACALSIYLFNVECIMVRNKTSRLLSKILT
jgi:hypothetical protein